MLPIRQRNVIRQRVHFRIRQKMQGTTERPRLNVYRSLNHIYAQIIDDAKGETLLSASSLAAKVKTGGNVAAAKEVGKLVAERAIEKGIKRVVFDRGGYLYHGRIKALADRPPADRKDARDAPPAAPAVRPAARGRPGRRREIFGWRDYASAAVPRP